MIFFFFKFPTISFLFASSQVRWLSLFIACVWREVGEGKLT